jgi:leucyl aminopeptidase (aminopeptidase T)
MDLFGKRRIAQLQESLAQKDSEYTALANETHALRNQVEYLVRTIRQTDDIIFSISQCTDWTTMRPRVAQLTDQMTHRKVAESNRINDLIITELHDTYNDQTNAPKRVTKL